MSRDVDAIAAAAAAPGPTRRRAAALVLLALALALVWLRPIDATAQRYVETGLRRALVTYASARALNAVISLTPSASVGVQIGAGASVQPGAVLDPLDDVVEQFSAIMLAATLSFAIQKLLIVLLGAWPVSALLSALLAAWCVLRWRDRAVPPWLPRGAVGLLLLSLAVPLASLASEASYRLLLAGDYESAQVGIGTAPPAGPTPAPDESAVERLKRMWEQGSDVGRQIESLKARASGLVEHLIRLAAVFMVQTVVLPLFFVWALFRLYRTLLPRGAPAAAARAGRLESR